MWKPLSTLSTNSEPSWKRLQWNDSKSKMNYCCVHQSKRFENEGRPPCSRILIALLLCAQILVANQSQGTSFAMSPVSTLASLSCNQLTILSEKIWERPYQWTWERLGFSRRRLQDQFLGDDHITQRQDRMRQERWHNWNWMQPS